MAPTQVFVSYTKRRDADGRSDADFVLRFLPRLRQQPLKVWVYEEEEGEIRGGEHIGQRLQKQIDDSQAFVPIVSEHAFQSPYTGQEVSHALARQARGELRWIIPIVSHRVASGGSDWPAPYRALGELRYHLVDFESAESRESAVHGVCRDVGAEYQPLLPQDPRLPHMTRFLAEVRRKCPRRDDREVGIYCRLLEALNKFSVAMGQQQLERARWLMEYFCLMCRYEFPQEAFYYPHVVRGVCEILTGHLDVAEGVFRGLLEHRLRDESLDSGMGYIHYTRGDYSQALAFYREALRRCPDDAATAVGVLLNSLLCGEDVDLEAAFRVIDLEKMPMAEDRAAAQAVQAFALAHAGRSEAALARFVEVLDSGQASSTTVVHFARMLRKLGDLPAAIDVLDHYRDRYPDPTLLHDLATCLVFAGNIAAATSAFEELLARCPQQRRYRMELAQIVWRHNRRDRARELAAEQLDPKRHGLPITPEDFYFDGLANWISGDQPRADYDFERSGFPSSHHYRHLLPD